MTRRQAVGLLLAALLLGGGRGVRQVLLVDGTGAWRDPLLLDRFLPPDDTAPPPLAAADSAARGGKGTPRAVAAVRTSFGGRLDVNTAAPDSLELLPGIGPALARRLVEDRAARGPFRTVQDLERVRGIGPRLAARLAPHLRFATPVPGGASPPPAPSAPGAR